MAHLTRVDFPEALRGEFEMALLRHYHACLTQHGLCLPWEECLSGYRTFIAEMTLIPLWQCCAFSLPRAYWAGSLPGLVRNFRRMGCGDGL